MSQRHAIFLYDILEKVLSALEWHPIFRCNDIHVDSTDHRGGFHVLLNAHFKTHLFS